MTNCPPFFSHSCLSLSSFLLGSITAATRVVSASKHRCTQAGPYHFIKIQVDGHCLLFYQVKTMKPLVL